MIKVKHMVVLAIILGMFPFCGKNPVGPTDDQGGERILFIRSSSNEFSEICTMKPDGSDIDVIAHYDYGDDYYWQGYFSARWSPDKTMLVVEGGPGSTKDYWPLWLMDMEGKLIRKLTWSGNNPIWKSNTEIIFSRARGSFFTPWDIYSIDINTQKEQIIYLQENNLAIVLKDVSNDGKYALGLWGRAILDSSGNLEWGQPSITKLKIGSWESYHILVTNNNISLSIPPIWSPDETLIAYALLDKSYIRNIYIMTAEGDSLYRLTDETLLNPYAFICYNWSADGHLLAYSKPNKSEEWSPYRDIFIIDIKSKLEKNITDTAKDSISNKVMDWL